MNRKNIFKTLAAAMLMPAILLTTSCSSEDDALDNLTENIAKKGYTIPVTVNVTRQGDEATTRATYNDKGDGTGKLEFTLGDQLFVHGIYDDGGMKQLAGTLDYVSDGKFSGTITTQSDWTGTIDELLVYAQAYLLPKGYESYEFLSINDNETLEVYDDYIDQDFTKAFALTKAAAVEQFSMENGSYTSGSGFALTPDGAVLNFTITGLTHSTAVTVNFTGTGSISKSVTTDALGTATFAVGVNNGKDLKDCTLSVDGNDITLVSGSKYVEAGKIYNITRSAASAAAEGHALSASSLGEIVGSDGKAYAVADKDNLPTGVTAVAMIAYVGSGTDNATYQHGLAIALSDEGSMNWSTGKSTCEGKTAVSGAAWLLPSTNQWKAMFNANGGSEESYTGLNTALATAGGDSSKLQEDYYWSSTESDEDAYFVDLDNGDADFFFYNSKDQDYLVRACLAF